MTLNDGFGRTVSEWLDDKAGHGAPGYLDEILSRTTRTSQRPWWASRERWLPVQTTLRFAPAPRVAWLLVLLALVLAIGAAALLIGSRPRLPEPFGLARNGVIVYGATDGDIYAFDPTTGTSRPLITAAEHDETPFFSRDGSAFVFARESPTPDLWTLMIAKADGSDLRPLTGLIYPEWMEWSPDGRHIVVVDTATPSPTLTIHHLDGSPATTLDVDGMHPGAVWWRPDGRELVFRGERSGTYGLYRIRADGTGLQRILPATAADSELIDPKLSPDGNRIVYTKWVVDHPTIRIVDLDTRLDREIVIDGSAGTATAGWPIWSADGTRLVFTKQNATDNRLAVGSAAGGAYVEIGPAFPYFSEGVTVESSPDGTKVTARYEFDDSTWLLDLTGGESVRLPDAGYLGSWQRLAP